MIVRTIGSGGSSTEDTLARAAAAATVCVDACGTHLVPANDRGGRYDRDATRRAAHHLRNDITAGPLAEYGAA